MGLPKQKKRKVSLTQVFDAHPVKTALHAVLVSEGQPGLALRARESIPALMDVPRTTTGGQAIEIRFCFGVSIWVIRISGAVEERWASNKSWKASIQNESDGSKGAFVIATWSKGTLLTCGPTANASGRDKQQGLLWQN